MEAGASSDTNQPPPNPKAEAEAYLQSLINKTLRVYTTDARLFVGTFKCTDPQSNIVLSLTHEYRQPSQQKLLEVAASMDSDTVRAEMTSRYLGLVVVPGEHIVKIEVEEFVSQIKSRSILERRDIYASA
ncbi:LSM domain-containing protein [Seiridium cupressi]|uniref:Sm domain-containing protein n=1 Tax=Seiridium unicorne TaxID=138068 RepID=A0ABR2UKB6_9PEZI